MLIMSIKIDITLNIIRNIVNSQECTHIIEYYCWCNIIDANILFNINVGI